MFETGQLVLFVLLLVVAVVLACVIGMSARYFLFVRHRTGMSIAGWLVLAAVVIGLCFATGRAGSSFARYRLLVQRGERIISDVRPGTSEQNLVTYLETNQESLGIIDWHSTENKREQSSPDAEYWYDVRFEGGSSLWSLLGQKSYLSIRIDGLKSEVESIHWGFE